MPIERFECMGCVSLSKVTSVLLLGFNASSSLAAVSSTVAQQYRVNLRVFFRALCPASQRYMKNPLLELISTEEYRNIIDLTLIPTAGMTEEQDGTISCEAGLLECTGHRWHVCVLSKDRDDVVKYLGTLACTEGNESGEIGDWKTKMKNCVTDEERVVIQECFNHKSEEMLLEMIREERSGKVPWTPYTVVNHKVLGSATEGVHLKMLKTNICSAYTGPEIFYPAECVKLVGEQKTFTPEDAATNERAKSLVVSEGKSQGIIAPGKEAINTSVEPPVIEGGDGDGVKNMENIAVLAPVFVPATIEKADKVQMEMYWRAFCPGCMFFITKQLLLLIRDNEFQEIIDFRPVPAAGMFYDEKGNVVCTAGRAECLVHKWLSCAVDEFQKIGELVEHIACMESEDNNGMTLSSVINRCFDGEALTKMTTCYDSKSDELFHKNVAKMQALHVPWVPYVLINGVPLGTASRGISMKQLMDAVCKAYSGPQNLWPASCQPKRLRDAATEPEPPVEKEDVVKPCISKKKDADTTGAQDEDVPGIGKALPSERVAKTVKEFKAKVVKGKEADDEKFSVTFTAVVLPGMCFLGLLVAALRLTRDHKKDA